MRKKSLILPTCFFFALLIIYEMYAGYVHFRTNMYIKARDTADIFLAFREWDSDIGSVYANEKFVPVNNYIKNTNKEMNDKTGQKYTMVNPAYLTRLVSKVLDKNDGITVRMVSENPVNPHNKPNKWESRGLKECLKTRSDFYKVDFISPSNIMFRYIKPIYVTKSCLNCHAYQGYKVGDVRGAMSITFPVTKAHNRNFILTIVTIMAYILTAVFVIILILTTRKKLLHAWNEKIENISELEKEIKRREMSEKALVSRTRSSSMNEILSLVAHHWRQPLNNIGLLVQSMSQEENPNELKQSSMLTMEIIKNMSDTIDLFTSAISSSFCGNLEVKTMVFDILRLLSPEFENEGIEIIIRCHMGGDDNTINMTSDENLYFNCGHGNFTCNKICGFDKIYIKGEEAKFKQILIILLKNAYDAVMDVSKEKGRVITLTFSHNGGFTNITVSDTGTPITPQMKLRLFEPYFSTKGVESGRGMGLFTARTLASAFPGAHLYYDDTEGKNFIFKFKSS